MERRKEEGKREERKHGEEERKGMRWERGERKTVTKEAVRQKR